MTTETRPIFIVSSGRSGTAMMEKLFGAFPQVEMHHEYMVHHVQPNYLLDFQDLIEYSLLQHQSNFYLLDTPIYEHEGEVGERELTFGLLVTG